MLLAVVAFLYFPRSPSECRFLTIRRNEIISYSAFRGPGEKRDEKVNLRQLFTNLGDYKHYLQVTIIF